MNNPSPKSMLDKLADTFANESIKYDLKPFSEGSRLIATYRKSMNSLMGSEPYEAYLGLGVLSAYENNYPFALQCFEAAKNLNPASRSPMINIATCNLLNGDLEKCKNILARTLDKFPNDPVVIRAYIRILLMFFCFDDFDSLRSNNSSNTAFSDAINEIDLDYEKTRSFLNTGKISLNVIREIKVLANQVFFSKFSINSSYVSNHDSDLDEVKFDEIIYIDPNLFRDGDDKDSIIFDLNESLQDKLIDLMLKYMSLNDLGASLNSFRNISVYFALDVRNNKV
jgi:tetratricopeptide (TPR) repeat protein